MSFEDEWAELNVNYWNCRADVDALQARVAALEELVTEYHDFCAPFLVLGNQGVQAMLSDMQQRARTLLHEGQMDTAKEEH